MDLLLFVIGFVFSILGLVIIFRSKNIAEWQLNERKQAVKKGEQYFRKYSLVVGLLYIVLSINFLNFTEFSFTINNTVGLFFLIVGFILLIFYKYFGRKEYLSAKKALKNKNSVNKYILLCKNVNLGLGILSILVGLSLVWLSFISV